MKKLLSILGTIGLTATSTTSLISCEKPNNNENGGDNKPEPTPEPQQPPKSSNWKLIDKSNLKNEFNIYNHKWYFFIWYQNNNYVSDLIKNSNYVNSNLIKVIIKETNLVYRWNENDKPQTPTIDKNTGKITNWKV